MIYQSPCYPCEYNFYSVDEFGDCKEDICKCPKEEKAEKCWLEQWAREEELKENIIMTIQDRKQQIINDYYCYDSYSETCDLDCDNCRDEIKKDVDELERLIRADAIDECAETFKKLAIKWFESGRMMLGDIPRLAEKLTEQRV